MNLRCEMLVNPLGIDEQKPHLSWQIEFDGRNLLQEAYYIIVSSSLEKAKNNEGDIWNSGKIKSSESIHIPYAGKKLASGQHCFWQVKVYTNR